MEPKQYKNYIAGIYLRLSRDDERAGESLSIENGYDADHERF